MVEDRDKRFQRLKGYKHQEQEKDKIREADREIKCLQERVQSLLDKDSILEDDISQIKEQLSELWDGHGTLLDDRKLRETTIKLLAAERNKAKGEDAGNIILSLVELLKKESSDD